MGVSDDNTKIPGMIKTPEREIHWTALSTEEDDHHMTTWGIKEISERNKWEEMMH